MYFALGAALTLLGTAAYLIGPNGLMRAGGKLVFAMGLIPLTATIVVAMLAGQPLLKPSLDSVVAWASAHPIVAFVGLILYIGLLRGGFLIPEALEEVIALYRNRQTRPHANKADATKTEKDGPWTR